MRSGTLGGLAMARALQLAGRRRFGFAAITYAFVVTMLGTTLPTPLYSIYVSEFHFSKLIITVIFATYAVGVITALLLFGRLSDEIGRRRVLLTGLAVSAAAAVLFLLASGLTMLLIARLLSGLSAGIVTGTATATLADLSIYGARGRATVVATMANIGGLGCGPLLGGLVGQVAAAPLRLPYWIALGLVLVAVVLVWTMPEPGHPTRPVRWHLQRLRVPADIRPIFVRSALAGFAGFSVLGLFTAVSPHFVGTTVPPESPAVDGLIAFGVFAASTVGQTVLVRLVGAHAMVVGCAGLILGMGLLTWGLLLPSLTLVAASGVLAGLGQGLSFRPALAGVNEASPPANRSEVASSFFVVAYAAISVPVVASGAIAQTIGIRLAGIIMAAFVGLLAACVLALLAGRFPRLSSR